MTFIKCNKYSVKKGNLGENFFVLSPGLKSGVTIRVVPTELQSGETPKSRRLGSWFKDGF
jgi:hypothetical protein